MKDWSYLILLVLALGCCLCSSQEADPVVDTIDGNVRGLSAFDSRNRSYDAFLGIPFAKPPIDNLRWQPSEPPEPWDDVYNATRYTDHCIQPVSGAYGLMGLRRNDSEDCLYLNVFVPNSVEDTLENPLPVMVFYYGGGLFVGTTQMYPGQELATSGELVVVTVNYRVSLMGFFSTGDAAAPGNYGYWDVKTSLDWINANIANFGGDTSRITIIGQSAGGWLVDAAVVSPVTNQLFHRGIAMSGGPTYPIDPAETADFVATLANCSRPTSQETVDCLREVDGKELDSDAYLGSILFGGPINFGAVIDGVYVTQDPRESWKAGEGNHIDFMTGYTLHDSAGFVLGALFSMPFNRTNDGNKYNYELYETIVNEYERYDNTEEIVQALYDRYPQMNDSDPAIASNAVVRVDTDISFASSTFFAAEKHAESQGEGSTYFYEFSYCQSFLRGFPDWVNGSHIDDIYSVLGEPFMRGLRNLYFIEEDFSEEDLALSDIIVGYYANFAYTGNPNIGPHSVPVEWPEYDRNGRQYLIQTPTPTIRSQDQAMIDNYNWILYVFNGLFRPEWGEPRDIQMTKKILSMMLLGELGY